MSARSSIAGLTSREEYSTIPCSSEGLPLETGVFAVPGNIVRLIDYAC